MQSARLRGLVVLGSAAAVGALALVAWVRSDGPTDQHTLIDASGCPTTSSALTVKYKPIEIGPVALHPGPEATTGADIKYLGYQSGIGFILKTFFTVNTFHEGELRISGAHEQTAAPMLFDYPPSYGQPPLGYRAEVVYTADDIERYGATRSTSGAGVVGLPGAIAVPERGAYYIQVIDHRGKVWKQTVTICHGISASTYSGG